MTSKLTVRLKYLPFAYILTLVLLSCSEVKPIITEWKLLENDTSIMTVAGVRKLGNDSLSLYFNESALIYTISAQDSIAGSRDIMKFISVDCRLKVVRNLNSNNVLFLDEPTLKEDATYREGRASMLQSPGPLIPKSLKGVDTTALNSGSTCKNCAVLDTITVGEIFRLCSRQSCGQPTTSSLNPCITFQYIKDGCHARAHKMGQLIIDSLHVRLNKIFSYSRNDHSLYVKPKQFENCCMTWWFHAALIAKVTTPRGLVVKVIDPGLFTAPVSLSTWLKAQESYDCASRKHGLIGYYSIQSLEAYEPTSDRIKYTTDPGCKLTDKTLMSFRALRGCEPAPKDNDSNQDQQK